MLIENLGSYTLEGAAALLIAVCAFKVYKARMISESDCCHHALRFKTSNRGDSSHDLQMTRRDSEDAINII